MEGTLREDEVRRMRTLRDWIVMLEAGGLDGRLAALYGTAGLERARERLRRALVTFRGVFAPGAAAPVAVFSGPGRTELGGNHTDHQRGHVLCAAVDLDILAVAAPNGLGVLRVQSKGRRMDEIDLADLSPHDRETGHSASLIRGVASCIRERGYAVTGLDVYTVSDVPVGSGLSSSAAFEVLLGNVLNHFFCGDALDAVALAQIGQRAENVHFGKPCGLMDQLASSVGGAVAIDFLDPAAPAVTRAGYDFAQSGHALCIVSTGSGHSDLTEDYAAVPREMGAVAAYFGRTVLREVPEEDFRAALPALRQTCGDRAVLRAMHFYDDDRRAVKEAETLARGDFRAFLELVNASGLSSALLLQNVFSPSAPRKQAIPLALALGRELLGGEGAIRVHGGGFAGTVQAFVPEERVPTFTAGMEAIFGPGACQALHVRQAGGCMVQE